jgi:site-specific DNA-cytosine methylase
VEPVEINSSRLSAQSRNRLYWTNIPDVTQPEDRGLVLKDILEAEGPFKGGRLRELFERHRERPSFSKDGLCHIGNADLKGNKCIKRVYSIEGKGPTLTTMGGGHREPKILESMKGMTWRKLTPLECERMQTMPDFFTKYGVNPKTGADMQMSNSARYKMIGNGWTVDVLAHLFKNLKDTDFPRM